ncbi:hypothetical protein CHS0354_024963 [Potamilus streckersoni]|uniref:Uncharacterized protein n=1 Tax=Potamilus streckersoni TaxID=2493646 RepID=A0AAE0W4P9_9BIVA|nr:hypothetical protein CHS0354_024963 [Potamilus streckersoni]
MKSIIVLAVAIGLVSVQTSMVQDVMSNDHEGTEDYMDMNSDDRDATMTGQMGNMNRNILSQPLGCYGNSCLICLDQNCLKVTYDETFKHFDLIGIFDGKEVLNTTIPAQPWSHCQTLESIFGGTEGCVTFSNVKISGGALCADIKIKAEVNQGFVTHRIQGDFNTTLPEKSIKDSSHRIQGDFNTAIPKKSTKDSSHTGFKEILTPHYLRFVTHRIQGDFNTTLPVKSTKDSSHIGVKEILTPHYLRSQSRIRHTGFKEILTPHYLRSQPRIRHTQDSRRF